MERKFDIPMTRLLGVRIKCKIQGRERHITLKVLECDVPLPIMSISGAPLILGEFLTTSGDISMEAKQIPQPPLPLGNFQDWMVEDILYDALGRDKPKEELNPELVGPSETKRKMRAPLDDEAA